MSRIIKQKLSKQGGLFDSELQIQDVSSEMLRDLFTLRETRSLLAESVPLSSASSLQQGFPSAGDLDCWGHHSDLRYPPIQSLHCAKDCPVRV